MHQHTRLRLLKNFRQKVMIAYIAQPSYSPDKVPCDFFLVPRLKTVIKVSFVPLKNNKQKLLSRLKAIPQSVLQKCFDYYKKTLVLLCLEITLKRTV